MATLTLDDYTVTNDWSDLVATYPILNGAPAILQCIAQGNIQIAFGGASPPAGRTGIVLSLHDSVRGDAANVWVRALGAQSSVSITLI